MVGCFLQKVLPAQKLSGLLRSHENTNICRDVNSFRKSTLVFKDQSENSGK